MADTTSDIGVLLCGCKAFCDTHDRDYLSLNSDGLPICTECSADGWGGELCTPMPGACSNSTVINEWARGFMCATHAAEHVKLCEEASHD